MSRLCPRLRHTHGIRPMTEETKSQTPDETQSPTGQEGVHQETTPAPASTEANASTPSSERSEPASAEGTDPGATSEPHPEEGAPGEASSHEDAASESDSTGEPGAAQAGEGATKKKRKRKRKKKGAGESERVHERAPFRVGEEVFGKVTAVLDTAIMIDLSGKALAIFDRGEMEPDDLVPEVGDRFVGQVLGDGARGGLVVLTRKPLREEEAKPKAEAAAKDGTL